LIFERFDIGLLIRELCAAAMVLSDSAGIDGFGRDFFGRWRPSAAFKLTGQLLAIRLVPSGAGCPPRKYPWYGRGPGKAGAGYRPKDETMRAVGLFTHGGPDVLEVVNVPEVHARRIAGAICASV
jgi:hypothetical protein